MAWVYILRCSDGSYYVGSTIDLDRRLGEHNSPDGVGPVYTRRRRPVTLVWCEQMSSVRQAFLAEKQIQGWSRRKREALIRGDRDALIAASRRRSVQERDRNR